MNSEATPQRDAALDVDGKWCEVRLYEWADDFPTLSPRFELVRRRHVDSLKTATAMVTTWLDGTPDIWDRVFDDVGTRDWYERTYGPLPTYA